MQHIWLYHTKMIQRYDCIQFEFLAKRISKVFVWFWKSKLTFSRASLSEIMYFRCRKEVNISQMFPLNSYIYGLFTRQTIENGDFTYFQVFDELCLFGADSYCRTLALWAQKSSPRFLTDLTLLKIILYYRIY